MELGADAVLMNTGIACAEDTGLMAEAMKHAVIAGRQAYLAGRMPKKLYATASRPLEGVGLAMAFLRRRIGTARIPARAKRAAVCPTSGRPRVQVSKKALTLAEGCLETLGTFSNGRGFSALNFPVVNHLPRSPHRPNFGRSNALVLRRRKPRSEHITGWPQRALQDEKKKPADGRMRKANKQRRLYPARLPVQPGCMVGIPDHTYE
jgi:hypothetical protein